MERLVEYFQYPFVRYAFAVGVLISLCSALFGVILVLKRFSFIGDGLSHVAFGAMAVAAVAGLSDNLLIVLPITVIAAVILLKTGRNRRMKGDAAVAVASVGALAVGYLLMDVFSTSSSVAGDVCTSLFGGSSILTLTRTDLWVSVTLSAAVILWFVLFYHRIFSVTFDEEFAEAAGVRASLYNLLVAVIAAVIIVLAMNLVGSLLVSALIVFPALSAMRVTRGFRSTVILSALISVVAASSGILLSLLASTPVGPTIVAFHIVVFAICCLLGRKS